MTGLTPLERAAITAILSETDQVPGVDEENLLHASILSRENTGGGFFTTLAVLIAEGEPSHHLGKNVWISVDGLHHGLGMILHMEAGRPPLLEGYAVGAEDTSRIDFEQVRFMIANQPGPLPANGS